ncbi:peptidylprolyl isomerase [Streptomyces gobiensis]|uniref:peptidylprolyl isomerase n=1 Tax=Streptomyces gobiensis TaxID=2875706 RepID=UPI001E49488A|nr:peptidylprolyl isomerase [Streptomyces gobiensis]UGY90395.1 peptidylprolyl isomerase [Streptomyces gobiensis]
MVSSEQRRKQLAQQKLARQEQRRAAARRKARIRNSAIAGGLVLVLAAGIVYATGALGGDRNDDGEKDSGDTKASSDLCEKPAKGEPNGKQWKKEPKMAIDTSASYVMNLETTCGDIGIKLDAAKAPRTVNSFNFLAGNGYFDHTRCHRLVDQGIYVLQCGDPTGTGQGGPGYTIPDENLKDPKVKDKVYPAGTVAMANTYNAQTGKGRNTGGSQFFLVYEDSPLPPDYTPFGTVNTGMDVLRKIAEEGSVSDPQIQATVPKANVVINKAPVSKS